MVLCLEKFQRQDLPDRCNFGNFLHRGQRPVLKLSYRSILQDFNPDFHAVDKRSRSQANRQ